MKRLTVKESSGLIHLRDNSEAGVNTAIKKLFNYEYAEENGMIIRTPFSIGSKVFVNNIYNLPWYYYEDDGNPHEAKIIYIGINGSHNFALARFKSGNTLHFWLSDIGKKEVYLTREEAEAALKKL